MAGLSLSGLASGVDTSSIVDQLMALERQKLTPIGSRTAAVTGQQDALKEVASKLSISEWTVSTHMRRIFAKLGVETRAAMVLRCFGK